ncbi:MAG: hypothetical protein M1831_005627 [Alyxoria varia]|nr:MAG: hypothetical protein M1831_005627 [Alyxoria varia]
MSSNHPDPSDITNQDPNVIAKQAEQDLNTFESKQGHYTPGHAGKGPSDSTIDSGINQDVAHKFQGGSAESGSTGASSNRTIPLEEGGRIHPETGRYEDTPAANPRVPFSQAFFKKLFPVLTFLLILYCTTVTVCALIHLFDRKVAAFIDSAVKDKINEIFDADCLARSKDFEGTGGPEDKMAEREFARGGDQDVQGNVRIQGETKRP